MNLIVCGSGWESNPPPLTLRNRPPILKTCCLLVGKTFLKWPAVLQILADIFIEWSSDGSRLVA